MTSETLLGSQVRLLLSSLSDSGSRHFSEIEADLAQSRFLLSGAIEKLGASFMAIHAAIEAQQRAMDVLLSGAAPTPEMVEKLNAGRTEIKRHVNAAVTGLQFEDMTSQVSGRMVSRINGMREVLDAIGTSGVAALAESDTDGIITALEGINKALEKQSAKLDCELWKAVSQTHMESGDVELF
jgi:hypothetical protein